MSRSAAWRIGVWIALAILAVPPVQGLEPRVAALDIRFYIVRDFPATYRERRFIAEHGYWNRHEKTGDRVTVVCADRIAHDGEDSP